MKTVITVFSMIVLALLSGCVAPPVPGELILTEQDLAMKSRVPPCHFHEVVVYQK
jgi:hypothetical protein